jgi:lysophospholipase L1-like esterase
MARGQRKGTTLGRAICFVILMFLAFIATLAYQEMIKPAANNPLRFATGNLHRPGRKIVVCLGASIVRGQVSFNFVNYLAQKNELQDFQFVNGGINSDLAYNLLERLDPVISCKPAYIIIQVGTDDLIGSLYPKLADYYKWTKQLPRKPDIVWYTENLSQIVENLKQRTTAKIALVALPMLGEAVNSDINREVQRYNAVIQKVASQEKVSYLSVYDQQVQYLLRSPRTSAPEYNGNYKQIAKSVVDHLVFRKSLDEIARKNGYLLHTDGIHLNTRGGMMMADQVEEFLKH